MPFLYPRSQTCQSVQTAPSALSSANEERTLPAHNLQGQAQTWVNLHAPACLCYEVGGAV